MNPLKTPNWFGQSTKESPNFLEELIVSLLRKPTSLSQVAWWNPTPPPLHGKINLFLSQTKPTFPVFLAAYRKIIIIFTHFPSLANHGGISPLACWKEVVCNNQSLKAYEGYPSVRVSIHRNKTGDRIPKPKNSTGRNMENHITTTAKTSHLFEKKTSHPFQKSQVSLWVSHFLSGAPPEKPSQL